MQGNDAQLGLDTSAGLRGYASWRHPFENTCVYLAQGLLRKLSGEALRGLRKPQVSEIGGILWGKSRDRPEDPIVITDAELITSETELYNTTPADASNLLRSLGRPRITGMAVVGYFRSHVRDGLCLASQDKTFIEQEMRDSNAVFLIIKPFEMGMCMAGFFFWQNGKLQTDMSDLEVPFVALDESPDENAVGSAGSKTAELENHIWTPAEKILPATPKPQQPFEAVAQVPVLENKRSEAAAVSWALRESASHAGASHESAKWAKWRVPLLLMSFLTVISAATYFGWLLLRPHHTADTQMGLQVVRKSDEQLSLSWNRNAPLLLKAARAKLTVTDGDFSHELTLDNAQLRSGKILYSARNRDIQFRLEVYPDDKRGVAESIRMASPTQKIQHKLPAPDISINKVKPQETVQATNPVKPPPIVKSIIRTHQQFSKPATTSLPKPSLVAESKPMSVFRHPEKPAYVPPRPIEQLTPDAQRLRDLVPYDGAQISIQVRIDQTGHVVAAHVSKVDSKLNSSLVDASVTAASAWLFEPATLNGKAVSAEHTIVFNYRAAPR